MDAAAAADHVRVGLPCLLAHRAGDENLRRAFRVVGRATREQHVCRTFLLRLCVDALAGLKSLAAADRGGGDLAIRRTVLCRRTAFVSVHDASAWQADDGTSRILGDIASLAANPAERLLRALQAGFEVVCAFLKQSPELIEHARALARPLRSRRTVAARRRRFLRRRRRRHDCEQRACADQRSREARTGGQPHCSAMAGHPNPFDVTAGDVSARGKWQN
jgi:hypothetical protein